MIGRVLVSSLLADLGYDLNLNLFVIDGGALSLVKRFGVALDLLDVGWLPLLFLQLEQDVDAALAVRTYRLGSCLLLGVKGFLVRNLGVAPNLRYKLDAL